MIGVRATEEEQHQMLMIEQKKQTGSFYTKREIVLLILDLVGYTTDKRLFEYTIIEPAAGQGAFLIEIVSRLIDSTVEHCGYNVLNEDYKAYELLKDAVCAIELQNKKHNELMKVIFQFLIEKGLSARLAEQLSNSWIVQADYLLWNKPVVKTFDFIVGNPPYIRTEKIEKTTDALYRGLYQTLYDRADIYVAFIEHGLEMLNHGGRLSYICTDRFTRNNYGREIRRFINNNFSVVNFLDIHNTQPFLEEVSAYPCIFTIENGPKKDVRTIKMDDLSQEHLNDARRYLLNGEPTTNEDLSEHTISNWFVDDQPWILNGSHASKILKKLESNHPLITEDPHNINISIGVATGANDIYIVDTHRVDIEADVLLPLVAKDDIKNGVINWRGRYVINPFKKDGTLIDLVEYPKLKRYFELHKDRLKKRSVAKKNPDKWYRTIDRIYPERLGLKKLLIPDIKNKNLIVLDEGHYYPEHSLYYLTAGSWNILALQTLLYSSIVKFFIWSYSTKMRGDYIRYQAQYLKKIRLPVGIDEHQINQLIDLRARLDVEEIDELARELYGITKSELRTIQELVE